MSARLVPALLAAAVLLLVAACGGGDDEEPEATTAAAAAETVEIVATDFAFEPATVSLDQPGTYTFRAVNNGETTHALEVEGQGVEEETEDIEPGQSAELTVEISEPGEYELYCPVGDHKERGMVGTLTVAG